MVVILESMQDMGDVRREGGLLAFHQHQQHLGYKDRHRVWLASGRNSAWLKKPYTLGFSQGNCMTASTRNCLWV